MPDLQFYPADDAWVDVQNGALRCCIPWSAIGTFTEPFHLWPVTRTSPKLAPSGGSFEFHGVDRYNFARSDAGPGGLRIRYGKTNYDILNVMWQVGITPALTSQKARPVLLALNSVARTQQALRKAAGLIRR
jgi:hypothetical protein